MVGSMKHLHQFLAVLVFTAVQPLWGQSQWVMERMEYNPNSAMLVYFGEDAKRARGRLQNVMRNDEFVEKELSYRFLEAESDDALTVRRELRTSLSSTWALASSKGFLMAQGDDVPSAEAISKALEEAGVRSPIDVLREFLKRHPDNLDAKQDLLSRLCSVAEMQTMKKLQLDIKIDNEINEDENPGYLVEYYMEQRFSTFDMAKFRGKKLDEADDLKIWGAYAQEFEKLFRSGEWKLIYLLRGRRSGVPVETCSQLMKNLYIRCIPQVVRALQDRPRYEDLWRTLTWMRRAAEVKEPLQNLIDSLLLDPEGETQANDVFNLGWGCVFGSLFAEALEQNKWDTVADLYWNNRHMLVRNQMFAREVINDDSWGEVMKQHYKAKTEWEKKNFLEPFLEALIRTSRIDEAEYLLKSLAKFPHNEGLTKSAAILASRCNRPDLEREWSSLQIQTKTKEDEDDYEIVIRYDGSRYIYLINKDKYEENTLKHVEHFLGTGYLMEWRLHYHLLGKDFSDFLMKRENLYGDGPGWAIGVAGKIIASGMGVPTEKEILAALEQSGVESVTDIMRKFIRANPNHINGKEELVKGLYWFASIKTKAKIGEIQSGSENAPKLSNEDDSMIWGEFAHLLRQLIYHYSNNNEPNGMYFYAENDVSHHSQIMKSLEAELLPLVSFNIRKKPTDWSLWDLWALFSDPYSSTQFNDFINSIVWPPFVDPDNRTDSIRRDMAEKYKQYKNWQGILNVLEDNLKGMIDKKKPDEWLIRTPCLTIIEAYLNLNQGDKLREWIDICKQYAGERWEDMEPEVAKLLEKYKKD